MNVLAWLLFGLIAGSIANFLDPNPSRGGILGSVVLGIVGALLGGWIGSTFLGVGISGFNLSSFLVSVLGALAVLWIGRMFTKA